MPIADMSPELLDRLRGSTLSRPQDFDQFWVKTVSEASNWAIDPVFTPYESDLVTFEVFDVEFSGWGGHRIKAWLIRPRDPQLRNGASVVEFPGYGGGRGLPGEWLNWPAAGFNTLVMDVRGQGAGYRMGDTPDPGHAGQPSRPGFLTQGILDPEKSYLRRVYVDAARAVEVARSVPGGVPNGVGVFGMSQGGGLAIAAASLAENVGGLVTAVPFLCDFRRSAESVQIGPYLELVDYCASRPKDVKAVFSTLSYFDGVHHASRGAAPSLWISALMDDVCPAASVVQAYDNYSAEKVMSVYDFAGHADARGNQYEESIDFMKNALIAAPTTLHQ